MRRIGLEPVRRGKFDGPCQPGMARRRCWLARLKFRFARQAELFRIGAEGNAFALFRYINQINGENMKSIVVSMIAAAGLMVAGSAMATDMPAVAKKNNCTACHAVDKKVVGPAWKDVATKADQARMVESITKGSKGKYGSMPMPPQKVSEADLKEITAFIAGLK